MQMGKFYVYYVMHKFYDGGTMFLGKQGEII